MKTPSKFIGIIFFYLIVLIYPFYTIEAKRFEFEKKALIWGVNGQDGPYLIEFLLGKGYEVHGVVRDSASQYKRLQDHLQLIKRLPTRLKLHEGDITNEKYVFSLIKSLEPDEIYNLAAQSSVNLSFKAFKETALVNCMGCIYLLDALCKLNLQNKTRYFYAGSGEIFGTAKTPHSENSIPNPVSPYAVTKLFAYEMIKLCRKTHNIFACSGILFNHESPLRGEQFVSKIVTKAVAEIHLGLKDSFSIGNLNAKRDWGYAKDYVEAMWLMLQQDEPEDFVIATQEVHSVRELIEEAFKHVNITIGWKGQGFNEIGYNKATGKKLVSINPKFFRTQDPSITVGNAHKAQQKLGWKPKVSFSEMVKIMINQDIELLKAQLNSK